MAEIITTINGEDFVSVEEAAKILGIKKSYLYQLTSDRKVPFYKYGPRTCIFKKSELEAYKNGRIRAVPTSAELRAHAEAHCAEHPLAR